MDVHRNGSELYVRIFLQNIFSLKSGLSVNYRNNEYSESHFECLQCIPSLTTGLDTQQILYMLDIVENEYVRIVKTDLPPGSDKRSYIDKNIY
ncbi:Uncharacterised protein [Yersinia frederiksenii]|nr:Uncharacterised protein [Yersinia frederiksenii]